MKCDLNDRIRTFPVPDRDFNFARATNDQLAEFGLPLRPDKQTQPLQYAFWADIFSRRPVLRRLELPLPEVRETQASLLHAAGAFWPRLQSSSNWSGAYVKPRRGRTFGKIYGTWQVPAVQEGRPTGADYGMSTWIGLDGQRRYFHASLPQMGTGHFISLAGSSAQPPVYKAWVQWWDRFSLPPPPPKDLTVAVQPGDVVSCILTVSAAGDEAGCFFENVSTNEAVTLAIQAPAGMRVSGATAQWITERPAIHPTADPYAFARYNTLLFSDCLAVATAPGRPDEERQLSGARLLKMYEKRRHPSRTANISVARMMPQVPGRQCRTMYR